MCTPKRWPMRSLSVVVLLSFPWSLGCDGGSPEEPPTPVPTTVSVTPSSATLEALGQTVQFMASVQDQSGSPMPGAAVSWVSSSPGVAAVDAGGVSIAIAVGATTISASSGSATGTASLTVTQVATAMAVTPSSHTLNAGGETVQLNASAGDARGNPISNAAFSWTSSNPACVQVSQTGLATSGAPGGAIITALTGSIGATASITVLGPPATIGIFPDTATLLPGATKLLTAVVRDAGSNLLGGAAVAWASSDGAIATVSADGLVEAVSPGVAWIYAMTGQIAASARITVLPPAPSPSPRPSGEPARPSP